MDPQFEPKGYSENDHSEIEAIKVFENQINARLVLSFINKQDKLPNTDGYIELLQETKNNKQRIPIGRIEVQVKKIPKNAKSFQCDTALLGFVQNQISRNPLLLICVDVSSEICYWKHIQEELSENLKHSQKSFVIHFSPDEKLDVEESYMEKWRKILYDLKNKDLLFIEAIRGAEQEIQALKDSMKQQDPLRGISNDKKIGLMEFQHQLNHHFNSFRAVKEACFPNTWQIGVALCELPSNEIGYNLFSIPFGSTQQAPFRRIRVNDFKRILSGEGVFQGAFSIDRIVTSPNEAAKEIFKRYVQRCIENKLFPIKNRVLAVEYIFSYLNNLRGSDSKKITPLGLKRKKYYSISEINFAFMYYLPAWCVIARKYVSAYPTHFDYLDPNMLLSFTNPDNYLKIDSEVSALLKDPSLMNGVIIGGGDNSKFHWKTILECLEAISISGEKIEQLYTPLNFGSRGSREKMYAWEFLTDKEFSDNYSIFFGLLGQTYQEFLNDLEIDHRSFELYSRYSKVIVFSVIERQKIKGFNHPRGPILRYLYLLNKDYRPTLEKADYIQDLETLNILLKKDSSNQKISYKGIEYEWVGNGEGGGEFIFREYPLLNMAYEQLKEGFKEVLNENFL